MLPLSVKKRKILMMKTERYSESRSKEGNDSQEEKRDRTENDNETEKRNVKQIKLNKQKNKEMKIKEKFLVLNENCIKGNKELLIL